MPATIDRAAPVEPLTEQDGDLCALALRPALAVQAA